VQQSASEVIWNLPNGLQGYAIWWAQSTPPMPSRSSSRPAALARGKRQASQRRGSADLRLMEGASHELPHRRDELGDDDPASD
jgi:hypothetical protein